jgi:hypothetical protein
MRAQAFNAQGPNFCLSAQPGLFSRINQSAGLGRGNAMSSPDIWQRIQELYVQDIYVGLRLDSAGLHAWITDRHFLRRADCDIKKGQELVMAQDLQRWLEAEAPKVRGGGGIIGYAHNSIGSSLQARLR